MDRQVNPFDEMVKRFLHVAYFSLLICAVVTAALGIARDQLQYLLIAIYFALTAMALNIIGTRTTDLESTFKNSSYLPFTGPKQLRLHRRIQEIITRSRNPGLTWVEKNELRKELESLIGDRTNLFEQYQEEIETLHPVLARKLRRNI